MPLSSWLSSSSLAKAIDVIDDTLDATTDTKNTTNPGSMNAIASSFDDIVTRFNELNDEVTTLQKRCNDQQNQITTYVNQLQELQIEKQQQIGLLDSQMKELANSLANEKSTTNALQAAIEGKDLPKNIRYRGQIRQYANTLTAQRDERKKQIAELKVLRKWPAKYDHDVKNLRQELGQLNVKNEELRLDLEYIKCTTSTQSIIPTDSTPIRSEPDASLPEAPFVLVLVDGDAYRFAEVSPSKYSDPAVHPAARMVRNIKINLQTYINANSLPSHCRFHVRVLVNAKGFKRYTPASHTRRDGRVVGMIEDFMVKFTESDPLFEFFDAGSGKERVDGKIHELYHMFLPNPSCHKIFLAVARDNGFARMFEPFIHSPAARAKTCLISAGDVALEIERLSLETVEWPTVFARQKRSKDVVEKLARSEKRRQTEEENARKERADLIQKLGEKGYSELLEKKGFQNLTRELMGLMDAGGVVKDWSGLGQLRVGTRLQTSSREKRANARPARDGPIERVLLIDDGDDNDDDDDDGEHYCVESGVD